MDKQEILSKVDHTLLTVQAVWTQIQALCDEAVRWKTASVCIPPSFVRKASKYLEGRIPVCTVVGFPNGYATTESKLAETCDALKNGAEEIDMVINLGWLREGRQDLVLEEIRKLKEACGPHILKVIVEACLLNEQEKITMCRLVGEAGADYIKTSTGFSTGGATPEDVALFKKYVSPKVKIKAAGGIRSFEDAQRLLELGADRLGTSSLVRLMQEEQA